MFKYNVQNTQKRGLRISLEKIHPSMGDNSQHTSDERYVSSFAKKKKREK